MTVYYGSLSHILSVLFALLAGALCFFLLRGRSGKTKKAVLLSLMLINLAQHLLKSVIYPHHIGEGFTLVSTAYNMCALLIILTPFALIMRNGFASRFLLLLGTAAGIVAILIPYWHIGTSPFNSEYLRYMICHVLLFSNSLNALLLGFAKPRFRDVPFMGLAFVGAVILILLNDTVCYYAGIFKGTEGLSLYEALKLANPVWSFGPPESFSWLLELADSVMPDFFISTNPTGAPLPVLWYAVPLYVIITIIAFVVLALSDKDGFLEFIKSKKKN